MQSGNTPVQRLSNICGSTRLDNHRQHRRSVKEIRTVLWRSLATGRPLYASFTAATPGSNPVGDANLFNVVDAEHAKHLTNLSQTCWRTWTDYCGRWRIRERQNSSSESSGKAWLPHRRQGRPARSDAPAETIDRVALGVAIRLPRQRELSAWPLCSKRRFRAMSYLADFRGHIAPESATAGAADRVSTASALNENKAHGHDPRTLASPRWVKGLRWSH